jgi:hypothetical protein
VTICEYVCLDLDDFTRCSLDRESTTVNLWANALDDDAA